MSQVHILVMHLFVTQGIPTNSYAFVFLLPSAILVVVLEFKVVQLGEIKRSASFLNTVTS